MKANTASKTAQYMALYRALETRRARNRRLFTDPYAIHFLDKGFQLACRLSSFRLAEKLFYRIMQRRIPGALASGLARTRYIDELLEKAIDQGARQVIILGAGFDTRSLRLPFLKALPVIEIDHPDTARKKLKLLKKITPAGNTRYIQLDFNTQDLDSLLEEQVIDPTLPTVLIWEGVTNYLVREAIDATFAFAARFPPGSAIIFTYVDQRVLENPAAFFGAERLLKDLDEIGESWTFGFAPTLLPEYLRPFSFQLLEDTGAADYREKYLPERKDILRGYEFYRVALAGKTGR